jgi:hypothetical protein
MSNPENVIFRQVGDEATQTTRFSKLRKTVKSHTFLLQREVMLGSFLVVSRRAVGRFQLIVVSHRISSTVSTPDIHTALTSSCLLSSCAYYPSFSHFLDYQ